MALFSIRLTSSVCLVLLVALDSLVGRSVGPVVIASHIHQRLTGSAHYKPINICVSPFQHGAVQPGGSEIDARRRPLMIVSRPGYYRNKCAFLRLSFYFCFSFFFRGGAARRLGSHPPCAGRAIIVAVAGMS